MTILIYICDYQSGLYLLEVRLTDGKTIRKKIIKI